MAGKRNFQLTEQQIQELKAAYRESADGAVRTRLQAVRLYGSGYAVKDVTEITGCTRRSLLRWCRKYRCKGIASLEDQRQGGNRAALSEEQCDFSYQRSAKVFRSQRADQVAAFAQQLEKN